MKIVDLSYHSSYLDLTPEEYLEKAKPNTAYAEFLGDSNELTFFFHSSIATSFTSKEAKFIFRKKNKNNPFVFPISLSLRLRKMRPDVVLVHSIIYIHFASFLRLFLAKGTRIFVQNHAEKVPKSALKKWVIKSCDRYIDGYFFVSKELALPWVEQGLIGEMSKVHEIMEGSSSFKPKSRSFCRKILEIEDLPSFIWVGRLDSNKDPMCVVRAFHKYTTNKAQFRLYMFYHTNELLETIQLYIEEHSLQDQIILKGQVPHTDLESWYNAADYFVAASHSEGSGYALCEAMSCGCVPLLSNIPSFKYMTEDATVGFLFEPGDHLGLYQCLLKCKHQDLEAKRGQVLELFQKRLSFQAIARKMGEIYSL